MWNQRCDNVFRRSVLIETLWNVNLNDTHCFLQQVPVLIETLWNVNNLIPVTLVEPLPVLIETLWNVNLPANNL